ncbi:MAG: cyclodeaminase/cyclohydrolase family protein [Coriobacteriia bacterium]|jgi:formiminotetrahydrofolate cyclodeaminase|nr:cyclodeaminase/cyclohydrolase family protein [Coriobacteriia bacterium]MDR2714318.1 cyclodeaminase/cyclohydrolase family protein [Coriobacteriales bacterium]
MSYTDKSCSDFIEVLASKAPVPGGGGAAALVGAVGVALGNMVGSLTMGKPRYAEVQADIIELKAAANVLQTVLLELVERDAEVFEPLSRAYGMPTETPEQVLEKKQVMELCLRKCCTVPIEIMECCAEAIELHEQFAEKGTALAVSDVGCGVLCCKAALQAASLNIFINTSFMSDQEYAQELNRQTDALVSEYAAKADRIFEAVADRLT